LSFVGVGVGNVRFAKAWREIEQDNRREAKTAAKTSGQAIQLKAVSLWIDALKSAFIGRVHSRTPFNSRPKFKYVAHEKRPFLMSR